MTSRPRAPRSRRITLLVNAAEDTALDEAARQKGVSRSDVLRESLRPYLGVIRGEQGAGVPSIRRGETA